MGGYFNPTIGGKRSNYLLHQIGWYTVFSSTTRTGVALSEVLCIPLHAWATSVDCFAASGWSGGCLSFTRFLDYISLVPICCSNSLVWTTIDAATSSCLYWARHISTFSFVLVYLRDCNQSYRGNNGNLGGNLNFWQARAFKQSVL